MAIRAAPERVFPKYHGGHSQPGAAQPPAVEPTVSARLASTIVMIVAPNAGVWLAAAWLHGSRAIVNLDYLALAVLVAFRRSRWLAGMIAVILSFDLLFSIAPSFNFNSAEAVAGFLQLANGGWPLIAAVTTAFAVVGLASAWLTGLTNRLPRGGVPGCLVALFVGSVMLAGDVMNGSNATVRRDRQELSLNLAGSSLVHLGKSVLAELATRRSGGRVPAASDSLRAAIAGAKHFSDLGARKIVVVVVESLGELESASTSSALNRRFAGAGIASRYTIRSGVIPSNGATTDAELRELCGEDNNYRGAMDESPSHCLPFQLQRLGFRTTAYHGYRRRMFNRESWYPRLGFDTAHFRRDLIKLPGVAECGTMFRGICDSTVVGELHRELTRAPTEPEFIYWVTLSSHFPIFGRSADRARCSWATPTSAPNEVCALFGAVEPALDGVASLAADPSVPPAWYVIVGDHPPPFASSSRAMFRDHQVPFIELRPRVIP